LTTTELAQVLTASIDAALLHRTAYLRAQQLEFAQAALAIPFLAGASEMAGQAFILAARRVSAWQVGASFALTGLVHVTAVALWALGAHILLGLGVSELTLARFPTDLELLGVVSLGYAPRLLGVLTIAPYYGEVLGRALDAWSMACVGWGISVITGGPIWAALVCAVFGWLGSWLCRHFGARVVGPLFERLGVVTAGMARG
jgi:hypothetical protein